MFSKPGYRKWLLYLSLVIMLAWTSSGANNLPTARAQPIPFPLIPLKLYWNAERELAATIARPETEQKARQLGYQFLTVEGYVFEEQGAETVPLKLYWHPERQVAATITSAEAEQRVKKEGYHIIGVEGYVYQTQQARTVPLKLYWHPQHKVAATITTPEMEEHALKRGYQLWRTEAYILKDASTGNALPQAGQPTATPSTSDKVGKTTNAQSPGAMATPTPSARPRGPTRDPAASHAGDPTVRYVIQLNIEDLRALDDIDNGSGADFYFKVNINGKKFNNEDSGWQEVMEGMNHVPFRATFYHTFDVTHDGWPSNTGFPIKLEVWDEDGWFNGGDDHVDIFSGDGRDHELVFDETTCSVRGNIGLVRGRFKDGVCRVHLGPYRGTSNDRAEIRYRIDFYNVSTYYWPMYKGLLLDRCRNWGQMCGEPAAQAWCHAYDPAFKYSIDHEVASSVGPTYVIGDRRVCSDRATCDGFYSVTCTTNDYQ
jgi:hypothetical protein